jgi:hypothetical protein
MTTKETNEELARELLAVQAENVELRHQLRASYLSFHRGAESMRAAMLSAVRDMIGGPIDLERLESYLASLPLPAEK